jgi:hypothetical protein
MLHYPMKEEDEDEVNCIMLHSWMDDEDTDE